MENYLDCKKNIDLDKLKEISKIIKSGTDINTIMNDFKDKVDYYIDGGQSKLGIGSTIVKIENGYPVILREGSISKKQILECLKLK